MDLKRCDFCSALTPASQYGTSTYGDPFAESVEQSLLWSTTKFKVENVAENGGQAGCGRDDVTQSARPFKSVWTRGHKCVQVLSKWKLRFQLNLEEARKGYNARCDLDRVKLNWDAEAYWPATSSESCTEWISFKTNLSLRVNLKLNLTHSESKWISLESYTESRSTFRMSHMVH